MNNQPFKKQRQKDNNNFNIINNNNNNNDSDSDSDNDGDNQEYTLIKLIDNIKLIESKNEENRIESFKYFNNYHQHKLPIYFNLDDYLSILSNVFLDSNIELVRELSNHNSTFLCNFIPQLFHKIIKNDKFYEWFKENVNDEDILKEKIKILNGLNKEELILIEDVNNLEIMETTTLLNIESFKKVSLEINNFNSSSNINNNNNSNSNSNSNHSNNSNNSNNKDTSINNLPDIVIKRIISFLFEYTNYDQDFILLNIYKIGYLAFISRRFFKIMSDLLDNNNYNLNKYSIKSIFNNNSNNSKKNNNNHIQNYKILKQPPLYFNYKSLELLPYLGITKRELEHYFSRIETLVIESEESALRGGNFNLFSNIRFWMYLSGGDQDLRESLTKNEFLVYPPPMPSLKNVYIYGFVGLSYNFNHLLNYIFKNLKTSSSSNNLKRKNNSSSGSNNDSCGIENFSIDIWEYFNLAHNYKNNNNNTNITNIITSLFKSLLDNNIETLKSIQINIHISETDKIISLIKLFNSYDIKINHISINFMIDTFTVEQWYKIKESKFNNQHDRESILKFLNKVKLN